MMDYCNINALLDVFGKTHPAVAHFPIALLITALLAELVSLIPKFSFLKTAGKFCLYLGTAGAIITTLSGFGFTECTLGDYEPALLSRHKFWSYSVSITSAFTVIFLFFKQNSLKGIHLYVYFLLLFVIAGLIIAASHTGGMLVYGEDFFYPSS